MRNLFSITVLLFTFVVYGTEEITQTDWSGGSGIPGPVTEWVSSFSQDTLLNETVSHGTHELSVENLQPGFYIVRMEAGFFNATEALVVIDEGN